MSDSIDPQVAPTLHIEPTYVQRLALVTDAAVAYIAATFANETRSVEELRAWLSTHSDSTAALARVELRAAVDALLGRSVGKQAPAPEGH